MSKIKAYIFLFVKCIIMSFKSLLKTLCSGFQHELTFLHVFICFELLCSYRVMLCAMCSLHSALSAEAVLNVLYE